MGRLRSAAGVALCLGVLGACSGDDSDAAPAAPLAPSTDMPSLSAYGIGDINRAVPHPCPGSGARQFDFWVGQWNVFNPAGTQAGTSIISSELDGCVIMEDWQATGGYGGRSMSVYDGTTGGWTQTFVDNVIAGSYRLAGRFDGQQMNLAGSQPFYNFGTGTVQQRDVTVLWTPLDGGRVNQKFVASIDGAPATVNFDGTYVSATELDRATPWDFGLCRINFEFRQIDFWLGDWRVASEPGPELGTARVTTSLNDCLIQEDFESPKGYRSRSFLYYDFVVDKWFRSFADNTGGHRELSGNVVNGSLVMTGEETDGHGRKVRQLRVTLSPDGAGVRQRWESSKDGGASWKDELVLAYRRP